MKDQAMPDVAIEKKKYWRSVQSMVTALGVGCMEADSWFKAWKPPEDLYQVLDDFAEKLNSIADQNGMFQVESSYGLLHEFVHSHPICKAWNEIGNPPDLVFTSRYDPSPKERQFIDLGAIVQNARSFLRREDEVIERVDQSVAAGHRDWTISQPEP
jgi:hypothetical protein